MRERKGKDKQREEIKKKAERRARRAEESRRK